MRTSISCEQSSQVHGEKDSLKSAVPRNNDHFTYNINNTYVAGSVPGPNLDAVSVSTHYAFVQYQQHMDIAATATILIPPKPTSTNGA